MRWVWSRGCGDVPDDLLQMDTLSTDYDKVQKANSRLQKLADGLEDEKLFLQSEVDRLSREGELRETALRSEEERCSRLREDLLTAREELSKTYLARDLLEQQKLEAENVISQVEKAKSESRKHTYKH